MTPMSFNIIDRLARLTVNETYFLWSRMDKACRKDFLKEMLSREIVDNSKRLLRLDYS